LRKYTISKSDSNELMEIVNKKWPKNVLPQKLKSIQVVELEESHSLFIGENFFAVKVDNNVLPLLTNEDTLKLFPSVSVDMGAIRFVCNGAKIMRPGIVSMEEFNQDDIVVVKDDRHGKYIAVGVALVASKEAQAMSKGHIIDNMHYVSDKFWDVCKKK